MLKNRKKQIFLFITVIGLLIFLHFIKILTPVENIIAFTLNPVAKKLYSMSHKLKITYNDYNQKNNLTNTIKNLQTENNQLIIKNAKLKILEQENEILRQHLKFKSQNKLNYILANVIARDTFNYQEFGQNITIDKGLKDNIIPGLVAVNSHGFVIGKITNVKDYTSKISLLTDKNFKLAVSVQGEDVTMGIIEGEFGLTIKMDFIPQNKRINNEDIVITSGLEKNIPKGLVIGKITRINKNNNEVWQNAIIEPLADLDNLIIVSVLQ
ncbi:MAG: rod shape-determining protein MreC [Patescibacteria group bacterium]